MWRSFSIACSEKRPTRAATAANPYGFASVAEVDVENSPPRKTR
jgi:hypothetical protein